MTSNQVQYWANREQARHNRVEESIKGDQLKETQRHNVEDEYAKLLKALGNQRSMMYHLGQRGSDVLNGMHSNATGMINSIFSDKSKQGLGLQGPTKGLGSSGPALGLLPSLFS